MFRQAHLQLNGKSYPLQPGRSNSFAELYVEFQAVASKRGVRYTIFLHPKEDVLVGELELQFYHPGQGEHARFLANGYQSWSETRRVRLGARMPRQPKWVRPFAGRFGDAHIDTIPNGDGLLHAWSFAEVDDGKLTHLFGSLLENTGLTLIVSDLRNHVIRVQKDISGLHLSHSFPALDFWVGSGFQADLWAQYADLVDRYASLQALNPWLGWSGMAQATGCLTEQALLQGVEAARESALPFTHALVNDGWQKHVGDWLAPAPGLGANMESIARRMQEQGMTPGLWLAPFVAAKDAAVVKQHPGWLLTGQNGKPLHIGRNPRWGGRFYALDPYNPGVRDYLSGVCHTAKDRWGFEWYKLDHLYAAGLNPPRGKTRGQAINDALVLLRESLGNAPVAAAGMPLGIAAGVAEICQTGSQTSLTWENTLLKWLRLRERPSTVANLRSLLNRWPVNGRLFLADPDFFSLNDHTVYLNRHQQHTRLIVSALLGGVLMTNDNPGRYNESQRAVLLEAIELHGSFIRSVQEVRHDVYHISFLLRNRETGALAEGGRLANAYVNLTGKKQKDLPGGVSLLPYETRVDRV